MEFKLTNFHSIFGACHSDIIYADSWIRTKLKRTESCRKWWDICSRVTWLSLWYELIKIFWIMIY